MPLSFRPYPVAPQEEEPDAYDRINRGVGNALNLYLQYKQQKDQSELAKQSKLIEFAKARAEYGDDFMSSFGQLGGNAGEMGGTATAVPAVGTSAPAPATPAPGVATNPQATQPAQPSIKSALDITPEHLAEIRKKKGSKGLKEFQDTQTFMTNQEQAKAQMGQYTVGNEGKLRDDYTKATQNFKVVSENIGNINSIATRPPTAAGDISLIFSYMKLLDPNSTVREGEYATAQNAAGVPDRLRAIANNVLSGQKLAPAQREDFIRTSGSLYDGWTQKNKAIEEQYRGIANRSGLNPENVIVNYGVPGQALSSYKSPAQAVEPPNGHRTIKQNGNIYQWNDQTGAYE